MAGQIVLWWFICIQCMYFIYLSKQPYKLKSLKVHFRNHVASGMKTECITLTMLERMRLKCWALTQGKWRNAHAFRANWSRSKENSTTKWANRGRFKTVYLVYKSPNLPAILINSLKWISYKNIKVYNLALVNIALAETSLLIILIVRHSELKTKNKRYNKIASLTSDN